MSMFVLQQTFHRIVKARDTWNNVMVPGLDPSEKATITNQKSNGINKPLRIRS